MNIIRFSSPEVMEFLGGPQRKVEGRKYRFNKFVITTEFDDDQQIWYNAFTGSVVAIRNIEVENIFVDYFCDYSDFLHQNYFVVPEDFDEESLVHQFRAVKQRPITPNALDRLKSYTILTTTECNARCFYCYQNKDHSKHHMTEQTARDVVKFIDKTAWPGQDVYIGWFGGEPLYNQKVIDIITYGVLSTGRKVFSSMISNGYLMDAKLAKKAFNEWHLSNIQITLDGTEEVYNKTKRYIYKDDPNPFKTVINNIHELLKNNILVSIRLNCGTHNVEDLKNLILYLREEFKDVSKGLSVYVHELFDEQNKRTDEQNKLIFENMMEIETLLTENGFRIEGWSIPESIKYIHCMVDSGDSTIISPGGELGLCEHYQNSKFYGHINNPNEKDFDVITGWREYSKYEEICKDCPFKPACLKSVQCPDHNICNKYEKEYILKRTKEDLKLIYLNWIRNQQDNQSEPQNQCSCGTKQQEGNV